MIVKVSSNPNDSMIYDCMISGLKLLIYSQCSKGDLYSGL